MYFYFPLLLIKPLHIKIPPLANFFIHAEAGTANHFMAKTKVQYLKSLVAMYSTAEIKMSFHPSNSSPILLFNSSSKSLAAPFTGSFRLSKCA